MCICIPYSLLDDHYPYVGSACKMPFQNLCNVITMACSHALLKQISRANRAFLACNRSAIGDEKHLIFDCAALAPMRQQHGFKDCH